jgi:hypothetical protein
MTEAEKETIIANSWLAHAKVEQSYLAHPASKGDEQWPEKQRLLLADMALHLLQTSLNPGELKLDKLQNNLYAILTIADPFLPDAQLAKAKEKIY